MSSTLPNLLGMVPGPLLSHDRQVRSHISIDKSRCDRVYRYRTGGKFPSQTFSKPIMPALAAA